MPQSSSVPDMGAVKIPEYKCRQSRFPHAPQLPVLGLCVGPSMSGKTNFLVRLITEVYRHKDGKSCFDRIYVFSPSVNHDPMWQPVRDLIGNEILDMRNPIIIASSSFLMSLISPRWKKSLTSSSQSSSSAEPRSERWSQTFCL